MLALAALLAGLVVAHDGALDSAKKVAEALQIELVSAPLSEPCLHDSRCAARARDQIVWLTPRGSQIEIDVVGVDGITSHTALVDGSAILDAIEPSTALGADLLEARGPRAPRRAVGEVPANDERNEARDATASPNTSGVTPSSSKAPNASGVTSSAPNASGPTSSAPNASGSTSSAPKVTVRATPDESAQLQSTDWLPWVVGAGVAAVVVVLGGVALINFAREPPAQQQQDVGNCAGACAGQVLDNCLNQVINGCANVACDGVLGACCGSAATLAPAAVRALAEAPPPSTSTGAMPY
jgi:hypothetical protein